MVENQSLRRRAYCSIEINGEPVNDRFDPYLISVTVRDVFDNDEGLDRANIELDDRDGRLAIPTQEATVRIYLGWAGSGPLLDATPPVVPLSEQQLGWAYQIGIVFNGVTESVESGFSRGAGGRRMWIDCIGSSMRGDGKSGKLISLGAGQKVDTSGDEKAGGVGSYKFSDFLKKSFPQASILISPDVDAKFDNWIQGHGESAYNVLQRYAKTIGYRFKIQGNTIYVIGQQEASGYSQDTIEAVWGVNLIAWRIKPYVARPAYNASRMNYFDPVNGIIKQVTRTFGLDDAFGSSLTGISHLPAMAPNKNVGEQHNYAAENDSHDKRGTGWAIINGESRARAGSYLMISGARPGVDGPWYIKEAEHKYIRSQGYTVRCELDNTAGSTMDSSSATSSGSATQS